MATRYATTTGLWSAAGTWDTPPVDDDVVVINANVTVTMDADLSAWANGVAGLTITSHAANPAMLVFKSGTSGFLKMKTAMTIAGSDVAGEGSKGRLLANSDGVWGNTGVLPFADKAVIQLLGTARILATHLNIALRCTSPTIKSVRTYGTIYKTTDTPPLSVDHTTDTFTRDGHGWANATPVMVDSTGDVPAPLAKNTLYYVISSTANTFKLAAYSGGPVIDLTSNGTGTVAAYSGHTNTATATMNVLDDVTGDGAWITTDGHDHVVLADEGPVNYDQQRVQLTTINAGSIALSANVDSTQYPNARIWLISRNVSIRSGTNTSTNIVDFGGAATRGGVFKCEIRSYTGTGTTFYGNGINSGTGCSAETISGCNEGIHSGTGHSVTTISGCNVGIYDGTGHSVTTISGCNYGIHSGTGCSAETISGCNYGIYNGTGHSVTTISGCNYGIYNGTGCSAETISGCNYGIHSGTGCSAETISGCSSNGIYAGTGHSVTTISGCYYGIYDGTGHSVTTISGCYYGINSGTGCSVYLRKGALQNNSTADIFGTGQVIGFGVALNSTVQAASYLYSAHPHSVWTRIYDAANGGGPQPGRIIGYSVGGYVKSEAYDSGVHGADASAYIQAQGFLHRATYQSAVNPNYFEWPISGVKDAPIKVTLYVKSSATGMAKRPTLTICDPQYGYETANEAVVATAVAADDTDWQTLSCTYTPTADKPLVVRVAGKAANGTSFYLTEILKAGIPAANKVKLGEVQFGYPGALLTPDYYPPNLDSDPGVENAAAVLTTAHYGEANAIPGTAAGGGPVFHPGMDGGLSG